MFKAQILLNEGWELLTEAQQNILVYSERRLVPILEEICVLFENKLSPDQIESIFAAAEQSANESGNNKTALGKAAAAAGLPFDLAKKLDATIKDVAKKAQDTTPVKNFDAQFERLKQKIIEKVGGKDAKIVQMLKQYGQWAKDNPGKSMLILGLLSAAASVAVSGGTAGAAVGFLLKMGNNLIQGEKLSTAIGKGVYGAAMGWLIGTGVKWLTDEIVEMIDGMNEAQLDKALADLKFKTDQMAMADMKEQFGKYPWFADVEKYRYLDSQWARQVANYNGAMSWIDANGIRMTAPEALTLQKIMQAWSQAGDIMDKKAISAQASDYILSVLNSEGYWMRDEAMGILRNINDNPEMIMQQFGKVQFDAIMSQSGSLDELASNLASSGTAAGDAIQGAVTVIDKSPKPDNVEQKAKHTQQKGGPEQPQQPAQESVYIRHQNKDLELIYERMMQEGLWDDVKGASARAGQMIGRGVDVTKTRVNQFAQSDTGQKIGSGLKSAGQAVSKAVTATGQAAGKTVGAGLAKAGQIKTNLTTKITKDKLISAWKKNGSPTDVGSIVNIMQDAGVTPEMMQAIQGQTQIELPANAFTQPKPTQAPQQDQPQQKPSQAFNYSGNSKNVSSVVDKLNSGDIDRAALLKYIQSKKSAA